MEDGFAPCVVCRAPARVLTHVCPKHEPAWLKSTERKTMGPVGEPRWLHALVSWGTRIAAEERVTIELEKAGAVISAPIHRLCARCCRMMGFAPSQPFGSICTDCITTEQLEKLFPTEEPDANQFATEP